MLDRLLDKLYLLIPRAAVAVASALQLLYGVLSQDIVVNVLGSLRLNVVVLVGAFLWLRVAVVSAPEPVVQFYLRGLAVDVLVVLIDLVDDLLLLFGFGNILHGRVHSELVDYWRADLLL